MTWLPPFCSHGSTLGLGMGSQTVLEGVCATGDLERAGLQWSIPAVPLPRGLGLSLSFYLLGSSEGS